MKNKSLSLVFALLASTSAHTQDFTFSQHFALPYLTNPSAAGHIRDGYTQRLAGIGRAHWDKPGSENSLFGEAVGWDMSICSGDPESYYFGVGFFAQHDGTTGGGIRNLQGKALFSAHKSLSRYTWLAGGVAVGALQYGFDQNKLTFNNQYNTASGTFDLTGDSGEDFLRENAMSWDADVGVQVYNGNSGWLVGATLHHFLRPVYSFSSDEPEANRLEPGYSLQAASPPVMGRVVFSGFFRKQAFQENRQWQTMFGAGLTNAFKADGLLAGLRYRVSGRRYGDGKLTRDALIPFISYENKGLTLKAAYDINISKMSNDPPGGLEISAAWLFGKGACGSIVHICPK
jgi:type IX secretion system PorP/SprF family membrane protein